MLSNLNTINTKKVKYDKINYENSLDFMNQIKKTLFGDIQEVIDIPSDYFGKQDRDTNGLFSNAIENIDLNDLLSKNGISKYYHDIKSELNSALTKEEFERVKNIPITVFPGGQNAGTWVNEDGTSSFIAIDRGLMQLIYVTTAITILGLKEMSESNDLKRMAQLLIDSCNSYLSGGIIDLPEIWRESKDKMTITIIGIMTYIQEMFVLAHEYSHHILGHLFVEKTMMERAEEKGIFDSSMVNLEENFLGATLLNIMKNSERQILGLDADNKAFEIMIRHINKKKKEPEFEIYFAALPLFFQNLYFFVMLASTYIIKDKQKRDLFLFKEHSGIHPPADIRRKNFHKNFFKKLPEKSIDLFATIEDTHQKIFEEVQRLYNKSNL